MHLIGTFDPQRDTPAALVKLLNKETQVLTRIAVVENDMNTIKVMDCIALDRAEWRNKICITKPNWLGHVA